MIEILSKLGTGGTSSVSVGLFMKTKVNIIFNMKDQKLWPYDQKQESDCCQDDTVGTVLLSYTPESCFHYF